jgi:hypothetical protein
MTIRKTVTLVEEINSEYGAPASPPLRRRTTARTPPPWRWGAWAERRELKVCLQRGGKRSRGKRRSSVGQNSSQSPSDTLWNMEDIVALIDARDERAKKIDAENAIA